MEFSRARVDNLVQRVESRGEMTELFEGRRDFLYYRKAVFDRHGQLSDADVETGLENFALQVKHVNQKQKIHPINSY